MMRSLPWLAAVVVAFVTNLLLDVALGAPLWLRWIVAVFAAVVVGAVVSRIRPAADGRR